MKFARLFLLMLVMSAGAMQAATSWDNSGNSMLNGTYYFRQVVYAIADQYGDLGQAIALYGNIKFDGNGNYSITTAENARVLDSSSGLAVLTATGTYSIAASGFGFMTSPINTLYKTSDVVYGLVSAQGIFVGSSTETTNGYNDMFIAAPLASPAPTASSFTGSWVCAGLDLVGFSSNYGYGGNPQYALGYELTLSPNGSGSLGSGAVSGYIGGNGTTVTTQSFSGSYTFSNGAAVATFPSNGTMVFGQKYFYFSKDGDFLFGGSPQGYDMIVGVKTGSTLPNVAGQLYYQAGIDEVGGDLDTFYGSVYVGAGAAPPCAAPLASTCLSLLGHQRINDFAGTSLYDYTYNGSISPPANGVFSDTFARHVLSDGGAVEINSGVGPYLGLSVALQAPNPPGTGVYLNPTGVVNSASNAPFTAGIAPGELLTLYGSNLAAATQVAGIPFPTSLGNVQVTIGGLPAAIYYVSASQISAIVPYGVTGPIVPIQVTNNGALSNVVTEYLNATSPGVFTQNQNGTGYGEIEHLGIGNSVAAPGTVVSDANPALAGETVSVYLTGLGAVSPTIADGAPGPSGTLSNATGSIMVYFGADTTAVTPSFAGLAPGYSGLYQLNVTVPATGLTAGPNALAVVGPDSEMSYMLIPISLTATAAATTATAQSADLSAPATAATPAKPKLHQPIKATPRLPGGR